MRRVLWRSSVALAALVGFCAAAPPREGVELGGSAGLGAYDFASGGCNSPRYTHRAREVPVHAVVTYRRQSGFTLEGETAWSLAEVRTAVLDDTAAGAPQFAVGERRNMGYTTIRAGATGRFAGFSLGPLLLLESKQDAHAVLSANLWFGVPSVLYVWGDFLSGPLSGNRLAAGVGLGHAGDRVALEIGIAPAESAARNQGNRLAASASMDAWITQRLSVGLVGSAASSDSWTAMARMRFRLGDMAPIPTIERAR
jgi:hypothetical protein